MNENGDRYAQYNLTTEEREALVELLERFAPGSVTDDALKKVLLWNATSAGALKQRINELHEDNTRLHNDNIERRAEVERARETQWLLEEELRKKKLVHSKTTFVNAMKNYVATLREVLPPKQDPYVGVNVSVVGMERLVSRVEAVIRSMEVLIGE